jgi:hypothetical protein
VPQILDAESGQGSGPNSGPLNIMKAFFSL